MAKITTTVCDNHEDQDVPAETTRQFIIDGKTYELDLCNEDAESFDAAVAPWVAIAQSRQAPARSRARRSPAAASPSAPSNKEVREWAVENGVDVNPMGRVPQSVIDQYVARAGKSTRRRSKASA